MRLDRRHFIVLSALALTGCAVTPPAPTGSPSATPSVLPSATPSAPPPDWAGLRTALGERLLRPEDATFRERARTENPRFDGSEPLALVRAANEADVQTAIAFARTHALPLDVRSGGHHYGGDSAGGGGTTERPAALVLDLRDLANVTVDPLARTVRIGPGASLARVYATVAEHGLALGAGSCATVGAAGLILGGGVGVLGRSFGLAADQLLSVRIVTGDGALRDAGHEEEPDLFWACRGGGGGLLGVVTELTVELREAPEVTMFTLSWPASLAVRVIDAWQRWAPEADAQLWSTLKLLGGRRHGRELALTVSGAWTGAAGGLDDALSGLRDALPAPSRTQVNPRSYGDAMARYGGCAGVDPAACHTGEGGALTRESFAATSSIGSTRLSPIQIDTLIDAVGRTAQTPGVIEGGVALDALGGVIAAVPAEESAFPHRNALCTAQYTAVFDEGAAPEPFDGAVRDMRERMRSAWGEGAYVNYPDAAISDPATAYFGGNAPRLAAIASRFDPDRVFAATQLGGRTR